MKLDKPSKAWYQIGDLKIPENWIFLLKIVRNEILTKEIERFYKHFENLPFGCPYGNDTIWFKRFENWMAAKKLTGRVGEPGAKVNLKSIPSFLLPPKGDAFMVAKIRELVGLEDFKNFFYGGSFVPIIENGRRVSYEFEVRNADHQLILQQRFMRKLCDEGIRRITLWVEPFEERVKRDGFFNQKTGKRPSRRKPYQSRKKAPLSNDHQIRIGLKEHVNDHKMP